MDTTKNQSLANGPVAEKTRAEAVQTRDEFSALVGSRRPPIGSAATGQQLTHYHSFFSNLLSWEHPRATALSYLVIVILIVCARFLPLISWALKATYIVLGLTATAEAIGKLALGTGVASSMRPQRYYTIPRAWLDACMEDATELINFFVIEFQRIVFAENIAVSFGAFITSLLTYFLIKITPAWGLALIFTTLAYFVPLVYMQNRELIDRQLASASDVVSQQTRQVRDLANQHAGSAMERTRTVVGDYSARARQAAADRGYGKKDASSPSATTTATSPPPPTTTVTSPPPPTTTVTSPPPPTTTVTSSPPPTTTVTSVGQ